MDTITIKLLKKDLSRLQMKVIKLKVEKQNLKNAHQAEIEALKSELKKANEQEQFWFKQWQSLNKENVNQN